MEDQDASFSLDGQAIEDEWIVIQEGQAMEDEWTVIEEDDDE